MVPAKEKITIIVATSNANKAREFAALLPGVDVLPMPAGIELPEETGVTFEENARLKAAAVRDQLLRIPGGPLSNADLYPSGPGNTPAGRSRVWVMADDSGLEVEALGGAPGIHSARYGGEGATDTGNVDRLLAELKGKGNRRARFVCVLVCVSATAGELVARGDFEGTIAEAPRGRSGFGYDPVFIPEKKKLTVSEIPAEEKNRISHRARAAHSLLAQLRGG